MSTKAMISVLFIVCVLGMIFGIGYGAFTHDPGPVVMAVLVGGIGAISMAALSEGL